MWITTPPRHLAMEFVVSRPCFSSRVGKWRTRWSGTLLKMSLKKRYSGCLPEFETFTIRTKSPAQRSGFFSFECVSGTCGVRPALGLGSSPERKEQRSAPFLYWPVAGGPSIPRNRSASVSFQNRGPEPRRFLPDEPFGRALQAHSHH